MFNYFKNNILSQRKNKDAVDKTPAKRKQKTLEHPEHGLITLRKIKGSHRLNIRVAPLKGITVTLPYSSSWSEAEDFIARRHDWIAQALREVRQQEAKQTIFKPGLGFRTRDRELVWIADTSLRAKLSKTKILIYYSNEEAITKNQELIRKAIERALKIEATQYLLPLLSHYATKHKLKLANTSLRASRGRWGSCSSTNDISLNIHLMRLPEPLQHYVLLHELAHTKEHNHSPQFWQTLDSLCLTELQESAKSLDKQLKNYSPYIY